MAFDWKALSPTQHKAVLYKIQNPSASNKEIAEHVGLSKATVDKWGLSTIVQEAMQDKVQPVLDAVQDGMMAAVERLKAQLNDPDQRVAQGAAKLLLEWGLGKPKTTAHLDADIDVDVPIVVTRMDVNQLL